MPDAFRLLAVAFFIILALQHLVIWLVSRDRNELERYTSYRMNPRGEVILPDYEI